MTFTQDNRSLLIDSPLGNDVLLLTGFSGTEGISVPFSFKLDLVSENHNVLFRNIIGQSVTVSIVLADGDKRYFNGIISRFSQERGGGATGVDPWFSNYTATMVPWFWLLTQTSDSRIFQKLSIPDIIERIFQEKGFTDYQMLLHSSYEPKDYCVQYRETDFNFISRLLEQEGIYYFFTHEETKHTLVMADSQDEHQPCPKQESARCQASGGAWQEEDVITGLEWAREIRIGKYTVNDFNFEMPSTDLKVEVMTQQPLGPGEREVYDYPAEYQKRDEGDRLANIRMQEEETQITKLTGISVCRAFTSGYRFHLRDFYRDDLNDKPYVLTLVNHWAQESVGASGQEMDAAYKNSFTCIPHEVLYRPPRVTPRPVVEGVQTAIVVGPSGEEIYTDEHGRVKVQFHWDREGQRDENSSCWIRVSQAWAGAGWGAVYLPRIGHEVIVSFLEGDPDRPIITGRVYHGSNKPPYPLPDEKTKSTIKSDSSLGGDGFNELRFEDKKGEEEIFLHGEKNWTIVIENDKNQFVGHDETLSVGNNRLKKVEVNQIEKIGANKTITVGGNHTETILGNMTETVAMAKAETIGLAKALSIGGAFQLTVGAGVNETVGAIKAEEVGISKIVAVGLNSRENIGRSKSVLAKKNIFEVAKKHIGIRSGKTIMVTAGDELTLKCGNASITLKKSGDIVIKGKMVDIKGSGNVVIKGRKILEN